MAKDPAALFYIDLWLTATAELDSDVRGWYLNLILHQYDKKSLPDDIEMLAVLAGVKYSEFQRFKQMFEQVLKHKFQANEQGRLENAYAKDILRKREDFLEKRSIAGKLGFLVKYAKDKLLMDSAGIEWVKGQFTNEILIKEDKQVLQQMIEQMFKLYINKDKDKDINKKKEGVKGEGSVEEGMWTTVLKNFNNDFRWIEKFCKVKTLKKAEMESHMKIFLDDIDLKSDYKPLPELQSHFTNWYNKNYKNHGNSISSNKSGNPSVGRTIKFDKL